MSGHNTHTTHRIHKENKPAICIVRTLNMQYYYYCYYYYLEKCFSAD